MRATGGSVPEDAGWRQLDSATQFGEGGPQIRSPKSEIRNKSEIRSPNVEGASSSGREAWPSPNHAVDWGPHAARVPSSPARRRLPASHCGVTQESWEKKRGKEVLGEPPSTAGRRPALPFSTACMRPNSQPFAFRTSDLATSACSFDSRAAPVTFSPDDIRRTQGWAAWLRYD
jgi:hypothetical protein